MQHIFCGKIIGLRLRTALKMALNLAAGDAMKKNKILRDTLDTTFEICKLLKYSPRKKCHV